MTDLWDNIEDSPDPSSVIKGLSGRDAGWLATVIRQKCSGIRERAGEDVSKELEVSSFSIRSCFAANFTDQISRFVLLGMFAIFVSFASETGDRVLGPLQVCGRAR